MRPAPPAHTHRRLPLPPPRRARSRAPARPVAPAAMAPHIGALSGPAATLVVAALVDVGIQLVRTTER
jgi:hypothetical protein